MKLDGSIRTVEQFKTNIERKVLNKSKDEYFE